MSLGKLAGWVLESTPIFPTGTARPGRNNGTAPGEGGRNPDTGSDQWLAANGPVETTGSPSTLRPHGSRPGHHLHPACSQSAWMEPLRVNTSSTDAAGTSSCRWRT